MSDQVEEVKSKTDIVSIIGERIELKKAGRNYKAPCPFHSEKTPSFIVSPEIQIYKCFGCGESGDVISFLEKYEGMEFYETLKYLAERAGVKLSLQPNSLKGEPEKFFEINAKAARFYNYVLFNHPSGKSALKYLTFTRGFKLATLTYFRLGYSPDTPLAFKKYLIDKNKIDINDLEKAGLVYRGEGRIVDRFRGRIIFPLTDHRGNITGFSGRVFGNEKNVAKYINTPETPIYHKSKILFGLYEVRKEIKTQGFAIIVEGELDMMSSWQAGIKNVVAIKGSALTQDQVKLLSRYCQSMVLALDADMAGDIAARRGIEIAEKEGFEIKVARLGKYKDPDEMARNAPEMLKSSINKAIGIWDFIIDTIFSKYKGVSGTEKSKISKEVVPVLASIKDKITQAHYISYVARKLEVPENAVAQQLSAKTFRENESKNYEPETKDEPKDRKDVLEERLLAVIYRYDHKLLKKREISKLFDTPFAKRLTVEYLRFIKTKEFDPSEFAEKLPKELLSKFTDIVLKEIDGIEERKDDLEKELTVLIKEIKILRIKRKLGVISQNIREYDASGRERMLIQANEKFKKLNTKLYDLEEKEYKGIILEK